MSKKGKHEGESKRKHHEKSKGEAVIIMTGSEGDQAEPSYGWAGPEPDLSDGQRESLARVQDAVEHRLSGHRLAHSLSVARTAGRLAAGHGVDPYLACAAGLLHDWDKKLTDDELWDKVDRYGIDLPARDRRMTPVLHGMTAARSLPSQFDLPPEVFRAISRHTVGACDMSDLDIVLYCADMLEPLRGAVLDDLRAIAKGPLDELFAACVRNSLQYLLDRGRYVYPPNIDVYNAYLDRLKG